MGETTEQKAVAAVALPAGEAPDEAIVAAAARASEPDPAKHVPIVKNRRP